MIPWPPAIDAETLSREQPVVIMSRGHSGTRLLARAIEALGVNLGPLSERTADTQFRPFTRRIKYIGLETIEDDVVGPVRPRHARQFRRMVSRYIRTLDDRSGGWGWKYPETYLIPAVVHDAFPRAFHVHLVRDGRDLAFKHHMTDNIDHKLGRRLLRHLGVMDRPHHVRAARSWEHQIQRYFEFLERVPVQVITLKFEELCGEPVESMERVAAFLERPMTDACRRLMEGAVVPGKVAQHSQEDPVLIAEVEEAIGPTLEKLGYTPAGVQTVSEG